MMKKFTKTLEQSLSAIPEFIFGVRAQGTPIQSTTLHTLHPSSRPDENEWVKEFKFGSRYGYRGSFYQK
jgi:hypothetical protein